jgi:alpha-glucosidase (family GH31 glycosyl hydrolase)
MPLIYPDDPKCENLTKQYMLGDYLLSAVYTDDYYLPTGKWIDYWTGIVHQGPKKMKIEYQQNTGGALLIKAGAVIPMWQEIDHISEKQFETIRLDVYPYGESEFTLYEDDGISLDYQKGKIATTRITCRENHLQTILQINPRKGTYEKIPKKRHFDISFHVTRPKSVVIGNRTLTEEDMYYDTKHSILHINVHENNNQPVSVLLSK